MLEFEVAVVGLGAMGSATLYQLARRGVGAVGIDRYDPPHAEGSSHGDTRITRQGIGEGEAYVPLVMRSHEIWRQLEQETGESLLTTCGALIMAPADKPSSHHGKQDFVGRTIWSAQKYGIAHEVLDAAGIQARFPHYRRLNGDEIGYFEPGGGYVRPERCIGAQLQSARELGAQTRTNTKALSLGQDKSGVRIETSSGSVTATQAVVTVGPWTAPLLGPPFEHLLTVNRQVLHWFALDAPEKIAEDCPVAIWMHGSGDSDYFYSFPPLAGENAMKVATEQYRSTTTADTVERTVTADESAAMYRDHVEGRLAGISSRVAKTAACVYTVSPDLGFIIDWHREMRDVLVVSACSGHGFKHSAGIGEAIADTMKHGGSDVDLSAFSLDRFASSERPMVE